MTEFADIPEEDRWLKDNPPSKTEAHTHEWMDMYGGAGVRKDNRNTALMAFYCKWCLKIRVKSYDQSQYKLADETPPEDE